MKTLLLSRQAKGYSTQCEECGQPIHQTRLRGRGNWQHFCPACKRARMLQANRSNYHKNKHRWPSMQARGKGMRIHGRAGKGASAAQPAQEEA